MQIISSNIVSENQQIDGRIVVREQHFDDQGNSYIFDYIADANADINRHLLSDAQQLNNQFQFAITNALEIAQDQVDTINQQISVLQTDLVTATLNLNQVIAHPIGNPSGDNPVGS